MEANSAFQKKLNSNLQMKAEKKIKIFFLFLIIITINGNFKVIHKHAFTLYNTILTVFVIVLSALNFLCSGA